MEVEYKPIEVDYPKGIIKAEMINMEPDEQKMILNVMRQKNHDVLLHERGKIIRKDHLGRYKYMVIELKERRALMGLLNPEVNKEDKTLSVIRILVTGQGEKKRWMFKKYTFDMDDYRATWRAWDGYPPIGRPWRGRVHG